MAFSVKPVVVGLLGGAPNIREYSMFLETDTDAAQETASEDSLFLLDHPLAGRTISPLFLDQAEDADYWDTTSEYRSMS